MKKVIVMLGTSPETMGGVSSVINEYKSAGLFDRFPIVYIPTHKDGSNLQKFLRFVLAWCRYTGLLLAGKVALVHVHLSSNASFWRKSFFFLPTFAFRRPSILHLHGAQFDRFYTSTCGPLAKRFVRYIFDHVNVAVVLSTSWEQWARSVFTNTRIRCIKNLVRVPPPADFQLRDAASILSLGRLGERKGTYDLLKAVSKLIDEHPNLTLLLGGDGEHDRAMALAREMGIDNSVRVLGWVSGPQKSALLERAAIYALPSYAEGLPVSVLEAMAAGLPVVSTPVGGIPDVITDGLDGCLVQPGDVKALCEALKKLLADEGLRQQIGSAARDRIMAGFSHSHIIPQIEQLYTELGARQ